jgi:hypothetical protein
MGAKNYEFVDESPESDREESRGQSRSKRFGNLKRRQRNQKGKLIPGGIRQRRNKHWNW